MKQIGAFIILIITAFSALAWEPTKPVNVVIAYGPGSGNEILFRKLDTIISKTNKVNFVLDFKPGAFELIGTIPKTPTKASEMLAVLTEDAAWIEKNHEAICRGNRAVANLVDGVTDTYLTTIYKLRNLM